MYRSSLKRQLSAPAVWVFLLVLAFYLTTLAPSVTWADGARLQMEVIRGGSSYWFLDELSQVHTDGWPFERLGVMPWDHPLYVLIGQAFLALPSGEAPWRINLISALAAALAIVQTYRAALPLTNDRWAAVLGALALAVSHTFWFHAVTAEVYALHALFMISLISLALRWQRQRRRRDLMWCGLLAGLGLANHLMLALTLLPLAAFMAVMMILPASQAPRQPAPPAVRLSVREVVSVVGLFVVGFAPWWIQFLRMARITGVPLGIEAIAASPWLLSRMQVESWGRLAANLAGYAGLLIYQFMPIGVALGLYGWVRLWRAQPSAAGLLTALYIIHVAFSANYRVGDRFAFHQPSYVIFALLIACGVAGITRRLDARGQPRAAPMVAVMRGALLAVALAPVPLYAAAPGAVRALGLTEADFGMHPIGTGARDGLAYFLNPDKRGDDSAARFGRSVFAQLAPNALVFAAKPGDREAFVMLRYFQLAEGLRPDVRLDMLIFISDSDVRQELVALARAQAACRPLYLASLHPDTYPLEQLRDDFEIVPEANLYRLRPRWALDTQAACPALDAQASIEQLIRSALQ